MTELHSAAHHGYRTRYTLLWLILVTLPLMACSYVESKHSPYLDSPSHAPLEIPAGLDTPVKKADYALPGLSPAQDNSDTFTSADADLLAKPPSFITEQDADLAKQKSQAPQPAPTSPSHGH